MSPLACFEPFASMQMRMQCRKVGLLHLHTLLLHGIVLVIEPNGGSNMLFDHGVLSCPLSLELRCGSGSRPSYMTVFFSCARLGSSWTTTSRRTNPCKWISFFFSLKYALNPSWENMQILKWVACLVFHVPRIGWFVQPVVYCLGHCWSHVGAGRKVSTYLACSTPHSFPSKTKSRWLDESKICGFFSCSTFFSFIEHMISSAWPALNWTQRHLMHCTFVQKDVCLSISIMLYTHTHMFWFPINGPKSLAKEEILVKNNIYQYCFFLK